jgi:alkylhydroperoxidase family enzyme
MAGSGSWELSILSERIPFKRVAPGAYQAMSGLEKYVHASGLEEPLLELVKIRASQINGCAF